MSSKSPQVIRHFIPLQFSKEALDYQKTPTRSYVKLEENPLQNMKLRSTKNENDTNFTLVFKNKSSKQFTSKFKIKSHRLLKQMQTQSQKCSFIKQQIINQELKMQLKPKPQTRQSTRVLSVAKPKTSRAEIKQYENRLTRQNQKEVIPRRIFSCKSFRKFTTVPIPKPKLNIETNYDLVYFQQMVKVKGRKNYIDYF